MGRAMVSHPWTCHSKHYIQDAGTKSVWSVPSPAGKNTHHGRIWGLNMSSTWEAWLLQWFRQRGLWSSSGQVSSTHNTRPLEVSVECPALLVILGLISWQPKPMVLEVSAGMKSIPQRMTFLGISRYKLNDLWLLSAFEYANEIDFSNERPHWQLELIINS